MDPKKKIKEELKVWIYYQTLIFSSTLGVGVTFEDINSVLIDILSENNKHDPKELFKKS